MWRVSFLLRIPATKEKIAAEYSTPVSDGIQISSEASPGGEAVRVSIQSTSGETIFEVAYYVIRPCGATYQ